MAEKSTSPQPHRRRLLIGAAAVAVVVAVALIVASQLSAGDKDDAGDRAAAVAAAAPESAAATTAPAAAADTAPPATSAPATTADAAPSTATASTLPYVAEVQAALAGVPQQGTILGDPDAPVTITEYADLRCPACRSWETSELEQLLEGVIKPGKAKLDLQLISILGPDSDRAAAGGWAAENQNKLWPFALLWYYNQGPETEEYATDDYQRAIAAGAGLDVTQFDTDRASPDMAAKAVAAKAAAEGIGFTGTPTFVVTGPNGTVPFTQQVPNAAAVAQAVDKVAGSAGA